MKERKNAGEKVLNKIDLPTGLAPNVVMASNLNILFLPCENSLANHVLKIKIQKNVLFRACLHGGGGPQIGEVACGGLPHLSCKRDQIKMRDYVDRRVTHQSGLPHLPGVPHLYVNRPLKRGYSG